MLTHFRGKHTAVALVMTLAALTPVAPAAANARRFGGTSKPSSPMLLAHTMSAPARAGVYGGSTATNDPIVLVTDAKGTKLAKAAFRVQVDGNDQWWPIAGAAIVVAPSNADPLPTGVLVPSTNARGRFDTQLLLMGSDGTMAGIHLKGALKATKATGTIEAWVTVTDPATGVLVQDARTPAIKWTAPRSAGHVYAGITAGAQPIVVTLNARRTKVSKLLFSCLATDTTPPGMFWSSSMGLTNFPIDAGHFGDVWDDNDQYADGSTEAWHFDVTGRVTKQAVKGTIAMSSTETTADGQSMSFRMPPTKFTATTG